MRRAKGVCEYCRCPKRFVPQSFTVEHIIPISRGGKTVLRNLAWACMACNNHKYNKVEAIDPQTGRKVRLFNPRRHPWPDHFAWTEDAMRIIGLTATGRATVKALRLNGEELINLRGVLLSQGLHPPVD